MENNINNNRRRRRWYSSSSSESDTSSSSTSSLSSSSGSGNQKQSPPIMSCRRSDCNSFTLIDRFQQNISIKTYNNARECGPKRDTPLAIIPFKELSLRDIISSYKTWDLLPLKNYLVGKKNGAEKEQNILSLYVGHKPAPKKRKRNCYFFKVDLNLLKELDKYLEYPWCIVAKLRICFAKERPNNKRKFAQHCFNSILHKEGAMKESLSNGIIWMTPEVDDELTFCLTHSRLACRGHLEIQSNLRIFFLARKTFNGNQVKVGSDSLLQNMYNLEASTKDVVIVAANGAEVKCHKVILLAQNASSLHSMFCHDMMEAQTGRIQMPENSHEGLEQFIRFLYGFGISLDSEQMTPDLALELFQLSHKYGVKALEDSLKEFLCRKDMSWFTPDTILELYFYSRNIESLDSLKNHSMTEMSALTEVALKSCDYFKKLTPEDSVSLLFQLLEWNK